MIVVPVANSTFANGLYITPIDYLHRIVLLVVLLTIQNPGFVEINCTELLCALLSIK